MTPNPQDSAVALEVERAAFEAYARRDGLNVTHRVVDDGLAYVALATENAWQIWKASRRSMPDTRFAAWCIELLTKAESRGLHLDADKQAILTQARASQSDGTPGKGETTSALTACLSACDRVIEYGGIFEGIDFHALKKGIERALSDSVGSNATGWQLVPVVPTDAMTWAGQQARYPATNSITVIYSAMLAAAPNQGETMSDDNKEGAGVPVAEVVNKFGDPEAFAERDLRVLGDIQTLPIGTKLYTAPPAVTPAAPSASSAVTAAQAIEALDELTASARGDEPFNHFAAPLIRSFIDGSAGAIDTLLDAIKSAQPAAPSDADTIMGMVDILVASMNEAHLAKSEDWKQACFEAADRSIENIRAALSQTMQPQAEPAAGEQAGAVAWRYRYAGTQDSGWMFADNQREADDARTLKDLRGGPAYEVQDLYLTLSAPSEQLRKALEPFARFKPHQAPRGISGTVWANYLRDAQSALEPERQAHAAEVERLREDAERYKLLRRGQHWSVIDGMGYTLRAEQIDAAIDQAIARGKT